MELTRGCLETTRTSVNLSTHVPFIKDTSRVPSSTKSPEQLSGKLRSLTQPFQASKVELQSLLAIPTPNKPSVYRSGDLISWRRQSEVVGSQQDKQFAASSITHMPFDPAAKQESRACALGAATNINSVNTPALKPNVRNFRIMPCAPLGVACTPGVGRALEVCTTVTRLQ